MAFTLNARKIDGLYRRAMAWLLGRPSYHNYFTFLRQDHKLPPDPRAIRRGGIKGAIVGVTYWLFATICTQVWMLLRLRPLSAQDGSILPHLYGSVLIPGSALVWTVQLLFHRYPTQLVAAYIGKTIELTWTIEVAFVITSAFALGFYIMFANSKDRNGLSMEHGSARYALPEEIVEIMPRNYDIWEGFSDVEETRRTLDRKMLADREARIAEYARNYLDYEESLRKDAGILPEVFSSPLQFEEMYEKVEAEIGVDPALLEPLDFTDVTPTDQPQIPPGTPKYRVDPALQDDPPPALTA